MSGAAASSERTGLSGDPRVQELFHDLRHPVATITALIAAAKTVPNIPPPVLRRLSQIEAEARLISDLTLHVLEDSLAPRPLDAGATAATVVEAMRPLYGGTIELSTEGDLMVIADEIALGRAISNLLDNAMRAAGSEGAVRVTVAKSDQWIRFDIGDSGPGFGSGPRGVAGLGLFIVDRFVRSHGGTIQILESSLGGALVRLSLPAPTREGADAADPSDRRRGS